MIYLGLGSNLGDRKKNLIKAMQLLEAEGLKVVRRSGVVESVPIVPKGAPESWNKPFLNMAIAIQTELGPVDLLEICKKIETHMGRKSTERWAPRMIDVDILLYRGEVVETESLTVPHREILNRSFVIDPLAQLAPELVIPNQASPMRKLSQTQRHRCPQIMGILNVTPDSFSDGGENLTPLAIEEKWNSWNNHFVSYIDVGAESTRPGADVLSEDEEWLRLEQPLKSLRELRTSELDPKISVDTYHFGSAVKALELGVHMINDVSGFRDDRFYSLAKNSDAEFVVMHSLSIPADRDKTLPIDCEVIDEIKIWADHQIENWLRRDLPLNRLILDPGVGFGKTPTQSLKILREIERLTELDVRVLVGHSRKSFMNLFTEIPFSERDLETLGVSLNLAKKGVDIIRVHNVEAHVRAFRSYALVD